MIDSFERLKEANDLIKTTDIKGKDYAEVNQRIKAFRMLCPNGKILTDMLSNENGICVIKASVFDDNGNLLSTGHAYEKEGSTFINKTSYIENCETSAVGRALGIAGFGIDVAIRSYEEEANAEIQQEEEKAKDISKQKIGDVKVKALKARCANDGVSEEKILTLYKVKSFDDLNEKQFSNINEHWDKIKP